MEHKRSADSDNLYKKLYSQGGVICMGGLGMEFLFKVDECMCLTL